MASPSIDLMCCVFRDLNSTDVITPNSSFTHEYEFTKSKFRIREVLAFGFVFCVILFLTATLSTFGAVFTLMPKKRAQRSRTDAVNDIRPRKILSWLAASDLLACVGVMALSVFTLAELSELNPDTYPWEDYSKAEALTCIILTAWVQFFYLGTYFWTFWYAVDVLLKVRKSRIPGTLLFKIYFILTWTITSTGIFIGIWFLYKTDNYELSCSAKHKSQMNLLPLFLVSFVPLVLVFVGNPIIYFMAARKVSPLIREGGVYTDRERKMEEQIRKKFLAIVVVFSVCWSPNLINGILLIRQVAVQDSYWENLGNLYGVLWLCMAVLNPLQAFLNSLVYWGPAGCTWIKISHRLSINQHQDTSPRALQSNPPYEDSNEHSPLLG